MDFYKLKIIIIDFLLYFRSSYREFDKLAILGIDTSLVREELQ